MHVFLFSTLKSPSKIICLYSDEDKSKFLRNASRWFMMLFLFGLYEQFNSHFRLWKCNSICKPSIGLVSTDKILTGISSLIKTIILPPCWSRSRWKVKVYPGIQNWSTGKDSSSLISEKTNTSMILLICLASKSNLFCNELILNCAITVFRRFFLHISFKYL